MDIYLKDFKKGDDMETFAAALSYMRDHPGSRLHVGGGELLFTSERAREAQKNVMNGIWGENPQSVMFSPAYVYDRGIDLDGTVDCEILGEGARISVDGFMETVSVRNCKGARISGFTVDCVRRPYSRASVVSIDAENVMLKFDRQYPITPGMPHMRACFYDRGKGCFDYALYLSGMTFIDEFTASFKLASCARCSVGDEVYVWHTFHSRPAILIENARDVTVSDVTVLSHEGMGLTAMHAENVLLERFCVIPASGEHMSANTDATHFASCRGKLTLDSCIFEGQGDDSINCHTYYYEILDVKGARVKAAVRAPEGTHTQSVDHPLVGDTIELTNKLTLEAEKEYRCISVEVDHESGICDIVLNEKINVENAAEKYYLADADALPELLLTGCTMKNHFARGALIKAKYAKVENCVFEKIAEHAVKIAPEASWAEGCATKRVIIKNCVFKGCAHFSNRASAVCMYSECEKRNAAVHGYAEVSDCVIECGEDQVALSFSEVKTVVLKNNVIKNKNENSVITGEGVELLSE